MLRSSLFTLSLTLLLGAPALAGERPLLAVLDFDGSQAELSEAEVVELTEIARKEALDRIGSRYRIITRENLVDLLKSHGKTLEKCQGECETETGRLIGADVVVSGAVRNVYGEYRLGLKAHDTATKDVLGIEKASSKKKDDLPKLITSAAATLYSRLGGGAAREDGDSGSGGSGGGGSGGGSGGGWNAGGGGGGAVIRFESEPAGAVVMVDGSMVCQSTPCQKTLAPGSHRIEMLKDKYVSGREERRLAAGETVRFELQPNFGFLRVVSEPPGLPATIDGKEVGVTPTKDLEMSLGNHRVEVTSPCHYKAWTKPSVARGERQEVKLSPKAKPAGIKVSAKDSKGNDLVADVYVDGKKLGRTPGTFTVTTCAKQLEVRSGKHGSFREDLKLAEKNTAKVVAKLSSGGKDPCERGKCGEEELQQLPQKLSASEVRKTLRKRQSRFKGCYRKMVNRPEGAVTVKTRFTIVSSGRVSKALIVSAGDVDGTVQSCILETIRGAQFPRFRDVKMIVNYPILLR